MADETIAPECAPNDAPLVRPEYRGPCVLRAKLWLMCQYMNQLATEIEWRRLDKGEEDCPSVNLTEMQMEVELTLEEYTRGKTAQMLDAEANAEMHIAEQDALAGEEWARNYKADRQQRLKMKSDTTDPQEPTS